MRKVVITIIVLFAVVVALSGCGGSEVTPATSSASSETTQAPEPTKEKITMNGNWKADIFEATVTDNLIVINIVADDTKSIYWQGTFPTGSDEVVSVGDREVMDAALLASQDSEKTFNLADGKISFDFTMMGTTKTVHMKKV